MRTSNQLKAHLNNGTSTSNPGNSPAATSRTAQQLPTELPTVQDNNNGVILDTQHCFHFVVDNCEILCSFLSACMQRLVTMAINCVWMATVWTFSPLLYECSKTEVFRSVFKYQTQLCYLTAFGFLGGLLVQFLWSFVLLVLPAGWVSNLTWTLRLLAVALFGGAVRQLSVAIVTLRYQSLAAVTVVSQVVKKVRYINLGYQCYQPSPFLGSLGPYLQGDLYNGCDTGTNAGTGLHVRNMVFDRMMFGTQHVTSTVTVDLHALWCYLRLRCLPEWQMQLPSLDSEASDVSEELTYQKFQDAVVQHESLGNGRRSNAQFNLRGAGHFVLEHSVDVCLKKLLRPLQNFVQVDLMSSFNDNKLGTNCCDSNGVLGVVWGGLVTSTVSRFMHKLCGVIDQKMSKPSSPEPSTADISVGRKFYNTLIYCGCVILKLWVELLVLVAECLLNMTVLVTLFVIALSELLCLYFRLSHFGSRCSSLSPAIQDALEYSWEAVASHGEESCFNSCDNITGSVQRKYRCLRHAVARAKMDSEAKWIHYQAIEHRLCAQRLHLMIDRGTVADDVQLAQELDTIVADLNFHIGLSDASAAAETIAVASSSVTSDKTLIAGSDLLVMIAELRQALAASQDQCEHQNSGGLLAVATSAAAAGNASEVAGADICGMERTNCDVLPGAKDQSQGGLQEFCCLPAQAETIEAEAQAMPILDVYTATTAPIARHLADSLCANEDVMTLASACGNARTHRILLKELGLAIHARNPLIRHGSGDDGEGHLNDSASGNSCSSAVAVGAESEMKPCVRIHHLPDESQLCADVGVGDCIQFQAKKDEFHSGQAGIPVSVVATKVKMEAKELASRREEQQRAAQALALSYILNATVKDSRHTSGSDCNMLECGGYCSEDELG